MARSEISYTWLRNRCSIAVADIEWLQCQQKVTVAHTRDGKEHLLDGDKHHSVKSLVKEFPDVFVMVRRGLAIAYNQIDLIENGRGKYAGLKKIHLLSGAAFYASRRTGFSIRKDWHEWRDMQEQAKAANAQCAENRELERAASVTIPPSAALVEPIHA